MRKSPINSFTFDLSIITMMLCSGLLATTATAQVPPPPPRPIDQGVGDAGPLSTSLRETHPGLRQPTGFDNVYHVPGRDDLFMRMDGGMVAVFPRSTYVRKSGRNSATVPPGTVFYIGIPTHLAMNAPDSAGVLPGWQFRLATRIAPEVDQPQSTQTNKLNRGFDERRQSQQSSSINASASDDAREVASPTVFTIANDQAYRARRVQQLLQQAAGSSRPRTDNDDRQHDSAHLTE
jgi:hypothetical protein